VRGSDVERSALGGQSRFLLLRDHETLELLRVDRTRPRANHRPCLLDHWRGSRGSVLEHMIVGIVAGGRGHGSLVGLILCDHGDDGSRFSRLLRAHDRSYDLNDEWKRGLDAARAWYLA